MKKTLSLLLVLCVVLACCGTAFAAESEDRISIGGFEFVVTEGLSDVLKDFGIDIPVNGDLMEKISEIDDDTAVAALRSILDEAKNLSDADLKAQITALAGEYGYELENDLIDQIVSLCREMQDMTDAELAARVEEFKTTVSVISAVQDVAETVSGIGEKIVEIVDSVVDFIVDLFS